MHTNRRYREVAILLAFLMFISSTGFSMNFHYCKGEMKSFSLIGEAADCHKAQKVCPRHEKKAQDITKDESNCCSNETVIIDKLDSDFNKYLPKL